MIRAVTRVMFLNRFWPERRQAKSSQLFFFVHQNKKNALLFAPKIKAITKVKVHIEEIPWKFLPAFFLWSISLKKRPGLQRLLRNILHTVLVVLIFMFQHRIYFSIKRTISLRRIKKKMKNETACALLPSIMRII